ncbi:MAG TPA: 16S rRNA (uracil(1498)-N(3))-methyltransferase [Mycobacteriales bacterium]|nr:16S rRNA (uracil(1498)-N(3))-methyltransferase [Mycobacteriales bacterium]
MTTPLFYLPELPGSTLHLDGPEGRHAAVVRRIRVGERVDVGDGAGQVAECVVVSVAAAAVRLDVVRRRVEAAPQPRLVVVQALAKGSRAEDAVEAMTEVGVDEILPWAALRSVVRWDGPRGEKALAGWRATAREAGKQSRRAWLPEVSALASTREVCARLHAASLGVVLHESAMTPLAKLTVPSGEVVVVVGPEGGITDEEVAAFANVGASAYRLGASVLRTSTAGVAAAAVLLAASGRWS